MKSESAEANTGPQSELDGPAGAVMVVAIVAVSIALVAFRQSMETIRLTW